ncbi:MAG: hypothetical protein EP338_00540 [Bacteroidetes bacterium]|nr:MAG: hypothetical protein EP338_00540 [Bacteroidota bacterium]
MGQRIFLVFAFFLLYGVSHAQEFFSLHFSSDSYQSVKRNVRQEFPDSLSLSIYLKEFRTLAVKQGHLLASFDSLKISGKEYTAYFFLGPKFHSAEIRLDPEQLYFLRKNGRFSERFFRQVPLRPGELSRVLKAVHSCYENNGYPFCSVAFDSVQFEGTHLRARLKISPRNYMKITKIHLVGNPAVSKSMISSFLQIREGKTFDQSRINNISNRIDQLGFVEEARKSELLFTPEGVEIFLYLKARPVSLINGVIGLQPEPITNKLNLTGEFRLKLVNLLKKAELFDLNWRSIRAQTQSLNARVLWPNLFQTPFGVDADFHLFKRDSSFLELKSSLAVQYALRNGSYVKMHYRRINSEVLAGGSNSPDFSSLNTTRSDYYGISWNKLDLDYLPNPGKGYIIDVESSIGSRFVQDSSGGARGYSLRFSLDFDYFLPLSRRHIMRLSNHGAVFLADNYFQNENFRFGGLKSLRGFREQELSANSYSILTAEYRFLLDRNSHLFAFFDQAWYENKSGASFLTDLPFGFGAGFTFGTKIGNFSLSYALGKQFDNPILLRDGKVHFGYISYF